MSKETKKDTFKLSPEDKIILDELHIKESDLKESNELKISEIENKIYFPFSKQDLVNKIIENKDNFFSIDEIINRYFIKSRTPYKKHPAIMRFKAIYHLFYKREKRSRAESFKLASKFLTRRETNAAIIDALKDTDELNKYLSCVEKTSFETFDLFTINFEVHPLTL